MVEVVVAAVLFAVASAGIFATISYTSRTVQSSSRVQAATLAKKVLDQLNTQVDASTWDTAGNLLTVGNYGPIADANFPGCTINYTASPDAATGARKVLITVVCP